MGRQRNAPSRSQGHEAHQSPRWCFMELPLRRHVRADRVGLQRPIVRIRLGLNRGDLPVKVSKGHTLTDSDWRVAYINSPDGRNAHPTAKNTLSAWTLGAYALPVIRIVCRTDSNNLIA